MEGRTPNLSDSQLGFVPSTGLTGLAGTNNRNERRKGLSICLRPSEIGEAGSLMGFSTDQEQHDQMLRGWVEALRGRGYTQISAALPEIPNKPRQTAGGSIPDLTALDPGSARVMGEVKTCADLDNDHTRGQLRDYVNSGVKVMLLVPESCYAAAQSALVRWGFTSVQPWYVPGS